MFFLDFFHLFLESYVNPRCSHAQTVKRGMVLPKELHLTAFVV